MSIMKITNIILILVWSRYPGNIYIYALSILGKYLDTMEM